MTQLILSIYTNSTGEVLAYLIKMEHGVTCPLVYLSCAWPGAILISPYVGVIYCHLGLYKRHNSICTGNHATGCLSPQICITSHWPQSCLRLLQYLLMLHVWLGALLDWLYWTLSYLCILAGDFLSHYPLAKCGLLCCQTPNDRSIWWGTWENWVKKKMVSHKTCTPSVCFSFSLFQWGALRAKESFCAHHLV